MRNRRASGKQGIRCPGAEWRDRPARRALDVCCILLGLVLLVSSAAHADAVEKDDIFQPQHPEHDFLYIECNVDADDYSPTVSTYFNIWNGGDGTLSWSLSDNRGWLSLSPTSGSSSGEKDRVNVTINVSGKAPGFVQIATISAQLGTPEYTWSDSNIGQYWLRVHGMVPPEGPLTFVAQAGNPSPQTFQFGMNGPGWENWSVAESASWLSVSPTSGTVSTNAQFDTLTASVDAGSLSPGTYTTHIEISSYTQSYRQDRLHYTTDLEVILIIENSPPVAVDDSATCAEDDSVSVPVLANDSDPDGDPLSIQSVGSPAHGDASRSGDQVVYTPDPDYCGDDSFTYTASDGNGGSDSATVSVTVGCVNDPPVAVDDSATCAEDDSVSVPVLANDSDPDGDPLSIQSVGSPAHGDASRSGDQVVYTPDPDYCGDDSFTYTASDGNGGSDSATVSVTVGCVVDEIVVAIEDASAVEGEAALFELHWVSGDLPSTILFRVQTGSTAVCDEDYVAMVATVAFDDAHRTRTVAVQTIVDAVCEADEMFPANLLTEAGVPIAAAWGTILDNGCVPAADNEVATRVVISEIAWSGTGASSEDEWIELVNVGEDDVDLTGWRLRWRPLVVDNTSDLTWTVIELAGLLSPVAATEPLSIQKNTWDGFSYLVISPSAPGADGFFLLERHTDATVFDVDAAVVYDLSGEETMDLPDEGALVQLIDSHGQIVDTANAGMVSGWAAGNGETCASMERIDPLAPDRTDNWGTSVGVPFCGKDAWGNSLAATAGCRNSGSVEQILAAGIDFRIVRDGPGVDFSVALAGTSVLGESCNEIVRAKVKNGTIGTFAVVSPVEYTVRSDGWVDVDLATLAPGRYLYRFGCAAARWVIAAVELPD